MVEFGKTQRFWLVGTKESTCFCEYLGANTLWHGLFGPGLWHKIIVAKYLKNILIDEWLGNFKLGRNIFSNVWNHCLQSYLEVSS